MTSVFAFGGVQVENPCDNKLDGHAMGSAGVETGPNGAVSVDVSASVSAPGAAGPNTADAWVMLKS